MIFETLNEHQIPYSIGVSPVKMKFTSQALGNDHFIIIPFTEAEKLARTKVKVKGKTHKYAFERTLTNNEIRWFYRNMNQFELHLSTKAGKIYERKELSLSKYLGENLIRKKAA